jgi:hypothetical protein
VRVNPLQSGLTPSAFPSEKVTFAAWPSLYRLPSRSYILPVIVPVKLADDAYECSLHKLRRIELSRLLLHRLAVLAAALQQVRELQRIAANAPEEMQ